MEALFDPSLGATRQVLVVVCLLLALGFEFVNGFHDTANAVATVIYTHSLKPTVAVVLSGVCNFFGVFMGGIAVAIGIINLLPMELVTSAGAGAGLAMVLALLLGAIVWNLGTWFFGLPASSSHTLIGAILGVGIANSLLPGHEFGAGVNWKKAIDTGLALLVSPAVGFSCAALLLMIVKRRVKDRDLLEHEIMEPPPRGQPPPKATRALLIATCTGVSFAHGSNDGQKGVGLVMLILMALAPAGFALDTSISGAELARVAQATTRIERILEAHAAELAGTDEAEAHRELARVRGLMGAAATVDDIPKDERFRVRKAILLADRAVGQLAKRDALTLSEAERKELAEQRKVLKGVTEYAPSWVLVAIALSLGVGTMVGWKRIVVTVGEKIGKQHLTYAQGACAEVIAAVGIGLASRFGLPVSTTHVLSSGIAGTMVAQGAGVHNHTVRKIAMAWVLTLPCSMLLAGGFYLLLRLLLADA